jgi:hypothetical protein
MSLKFSVFENNIDKCWYDSTNIIYSECEDKVDDFKALKIVFKGGRTYNYKEIDVRDYVAFKHATSQGKALNTFLKKYEYEKVEESTDLELLNEELEERQVTDFYFYEEANGEVRLKNKNGDEILVLSGNLQAAEHKDLITLIVSAMGIKTKWKK